MKTADGQRIGRVAGTPNKLTKTVKEMILGALERGGGEDYLLRQMELNPVAFMALVGKMVPTTVAGDKDAPLFPGVTLAELNKRIIGRLVAAGMSQHDAERAFLDG